MFGRTATCSALATACLLAVSLNVAAAGPRHDAREKAEVAAIFDMLTSRMKPGDGPAWDLPCVIDDNWPDSPRGSGKNFRHVRPRALLTPREALDPKGEHAEMFCNREERDRRAADMALQLPDETARRGIRVADMRFTYPDFDRSLTRAVVHHAGENRTFTRIGKPSFVGSYRTITLKKVAGVWQARFETDGIAN